MEKEDKAHAHCMFTDALKVLTKEKKPTSRTKSLEGLAFCNRLFEIERELKDLTPEERYTARLEQSKSLLDAFLAWLKENKQSALPKSLLGKAITYCLNQWPRLEGILLDGRLEISNNRGERGIKLLLSVEKLVICQHSQRGQSQCCYLQYCGDNQGQWPKSVPLPNVSF